MLANVIVVVVDCADADMGSPALGSNLPVPVVAVGFGLK